MKDESLLIFHHEAGFSICQQKGESSLIPGWRPGSEQQQMSIWCANRPRRVLHCKGVLTRIVDMRESEQRGNSLSCRFGLSLRRSVGFIAVCMVAVAAVHGAGQQESDLWYENAPGRPERFLPGLVSSPRFEHGPLAVSPSMDELLWTSHFAEDPLSRIQSASLTVDGWSDPRVEEFSLPHGSGEPFFVDQDTLIFRSDRPLPGSEAPARAIWTVSRNADGWQDPVPLGRSFVGVSWQSSMDDAGTVYYVMDEAARSDCLGMDDLYFAEKSGDTYGFPQNPGRPINTEYYESGPFVSPDGKTLLFSSSRPGGRGRRDLYVCFRDNDGNWTAPRNLSRQINTAGHEDWPSLSPDGSCLFFVRSRNDDGDVFWVDASFLAAMRQEVAQ
jgi:WD40 repeat protein